MFCLNLSSPPNPPATQGMQGNTGPWGEVGSRGPPGAMGLQGQIGPRGVTGYPVSLFKYNFYFLNGRGADVLHYIIYIISLNARFFITFL